MARELRTLWVGLRLILPVIAGLFVALFAMFFSMFWLGVLPSLILGLVVVILWVSYQLGRELEGF